MRKISNSVKRGTELKRTRTGSRSFSKSAPPFEKLVGDLAGAYSRRLTIGHRLGYEVLAAEKTVRILRMWTHYE